ncbi:sulfite exporter TauE/SafE family protein [Devosia sp.]|uniref:sulfite exporter TauE/SafE family protein n=1 Tax=Devosia sp. TaxID=1871048 RepID=UPI0025B7BF57|nr:sulfite exporter TauE/SafE family protein [Devosia sp.]
MVWGIDPLYSLSGLFVGLVVGLTGVGGGSLMTPLLILLFNVHPATAVGTDLLFAATTKTAGTLVHGFNGHVDWRVVARLGVGSVSASAVTLLVLHQLGGSDPGVAHVLALVLGGMLVLTALSLLFRRWLFRFAHRHRELPPLSQAAITVAFGALLGVLVSVSSVGAGAIGVTVLMLLYPRLSLVRIVATDIAHAVPLTLVAGLGHWLIGNVEWSMLASLLVGSIPGIVIASMFAPKVPEAAVRYLLAAVLAIVGLRLLVS